MTHQSEQQLEKTLKIYFLDILPEILDEQQKKNKMRNIVYAMSKKDKTIINKGTSRHSKWVKV